MRSSGAASQYAAAADGPIVTAGHDTGKHVETTGAQDIIGAKIQG